jgi:hypothetical protein
VGASKPTKGELRDERRRNARKMRVDGAGVRRVYPAAVLKRTKEAKE